MESLILSGLAALSCSQYRQVPDDCSDMYIEDREMTPMSPIDDSPMGDHHHHLGSIDNHRHHLQHHSHPHPHQLPHPHPHHQEHEHEHEQEEEQEQNRFSCSSSNAQKSYIPGRV